MLHFQRNNQSNFNHFPDLKPELKGSRQLFFYNDLLYLNSYQLVNNVSLKGKVGGSVEVVQSSGDSWAYWEHSLLGSEGDGDNSLSQRSIYYSSNLSISFLFGNLNKSDGGDI